MFLSLNKNKDEQIENVSDDNEKVKILYKMIIELKKENNEIKKILSDLIGSKTFNEKMLNN